MLYDPLTRIIITLVVAIIALDFVEQRGRRSFSSRMYRFGIPAFRDSRSLPCPREGVGTTFETTCGVVKLAAPDEYMFYTRQGFWNRPGLTIGGVMHWEGGVATIEARFPVALILWWVIWALFIVGLAAVETRDGLLGGALMLVAIGLGGLALSAAYSVRRELRAAHSIVDELERRVRERPVSGDADASQVGGDSGRGVQLEPGSDFTWD